MASSESVQLSPGARLPSSASAASPVVVRARHSALVRLAHWIITLCFFALLLTGIEILISHPRFYWGETGNDLTTPLFRIPIPSSRNLVLTGYGYVLPDENGWSRALHFQAAWAMVLTGLLYVVSGLFTGHFRRNLLPSRTDLSWRGFSAAIVSHLRFERPSEDDSWSYNFLQRLAYLLLIFILFPLIIWTGLAMSPTFTSAFPSTAILLGGRQSARTIHFFASMALVLFLIVHIVMICLAGFRQRTRAMITGRARRSVERT